MSGILALVAAGGGFTLAISPGDQYRSGTTQIYTFTAETVTVTGGVSPSYNWSFIGGTSGTWQIFSGQGTASCTIKVSNMSAGLDGNILLTCTVVCAGVAKDISTTLSYTNTN